MEVQGSGFLTKAARRQKHICTTVNHQLRIAAIDHYGADKRIARFLHLVHIHLFDHGGCMKCNGLLLCLLPGQEER